MTALLGPKEQESILSQLQALFDAEADFHAMLDALNDQDENITFRHPD
jgi:hypothetical protein